jgi:hypothetical protein
VEVAEEVLAQQDLRVRAVEQATALLELLILAVAVEVQDYLTPLAVMAVQVL